MLMKSSEFTGIKLKLSELIQMMNIFVKPLHNSFLLCSGIKFKTRRFWTL